MSYKITKYTKDKAKKIGVEVKPSNKRDKKIDVFKNGTLVASIGAIGYSDYPTYLLSRGKKYAEERRRLYKKRHAENRKKRYTTGWYADQLLW